MTSNQPSKFNTWEITLRLDERSISGLKTFLTANPLIKIIQIKSDDLNLALREVKR